MNATDPIEEFDARHSVSFLRTMALALRGPLARKHTILAVCPTSAAVVRGALAAVSEARAPLLFAATLNQVDCDGGYTGWTPHAFSDFVLHAHRRNENVSPVVICLDHGGPWKKDHHRTAGLSFDQTWDAVVQSMTACRKAGYALFHVDCTTDIRLPRGAQVDVDDLAERTVTLMRSVVDSGDPVAFETGVEEQRAERDRFDSFFRVFDRKRGDLPRPIFAVGDLGTALDVSHFDPSRARGLVRKAAAFGALVKGHYTDAVVDPSIYPSCGIGAANVGPGLAMVEYDALMDLEAKEHRLGGKSDFSATLRSALIKSGRWRKWCLPEETTTFDRLSPERQRWLLRTGSRYIWKHPDVVASRQLLCKNIRDVCNGGAFVESRIKDAVLRYIRAFNLVGFTDRMARL